MKLLIGCDGGLCNRLAPLLSALRLRRLYGFDLLVYWPWTNSRHFSLAFDAVFEGRDFEITTDYGVFSNKTLAVRSEDATNFLAPWDVEEDGAWFTCSWVVERKDYASHLRELLPPIPQALREALAFRKEYLERADEFCKAEGVDRSTTAVALRKFPAPGSSKRSDMPVLSDSQIREYIDSLPNERLLLETNSMPTQRRFLRRYGERLFVFPKQTRPQLSDGDNYELRSPEALREAIVAFIILTRVGSILSNSSGSTFHIGAMAVGNVGNIVEGWETFWKYGGGP